MNLRRTSRLAALVGSLACIAAIAPEADAGPPRGSRHHGSAHSHGHHRGHGHARSHSSFRHSISGHRHGHRQHHGHAGHGHHRHHRSLHHGHSHRRSHYYYRPGLSYGYGRSYCPPYRSSYLPSYGRSYTYYPRERVRYVTAPVEVVEPRRSTATPPPVELSRGWDHLARGENVEALSVFSQHAIAEPVAGPPKAGYALAAALEGSDRSAVWAMRRAFSLDAEALHYLVLDEALGKKLDALLDRYRYQAGHAAQEADARFMLAAVHFLRREYVEADAELRASVARRGEAEAADRAMRELLDLDLRESSALPGPIGPASAPAPGPALPSGDAPDDDGGEIGDEGPGRQQARAGGAGYQVIRTERWLEIRPVKSD